MAFSAKGIIMFRVLLATIVLTGCASQPSVVSNPIRPVHVNCYQAAQHSADLQQIIDNPSVSSGYWNNAFDQLSGRETHQQRVSSAKTVLWTIRTRCPGS